MGSAAWTLNAMMHVDHKPWGKCYHLSTTPDEQVDLCEIVAGGHSSIHRHDDKFNLFVVVAGELQVRTFADNLSAPLTHHLRAGDSFVVPPGVKHQFLAVRDTRLVEVYWRANDVVDVREDDIHRFSENGVDARAAAEAVGRAECEG